MSIQRSYFNILVLLPYFLILSCSSTTSKDISINTQVQKQDTLWKEKAAWMVETQIISRGVNDPQVIEALKSTPRHIFVPSKMKAYAYEDTPLHIGEGQTISQPYIVALMTELLELKKEDRVLEIGTGSGYQAAILSKLAKTCYSIEIVKVLAERAKQVLKDQNVNNVIIKHGDGYQGWPEYAPYDKVIVTAAPPEIPQELIKQLKVGGKMVIPVGEEYQELLLITKDSEQHTREEKIIPVRFVPMVHPENELK